MTTKELELEAMKNNPLPDGLSLGDQAFYIAMRSLWQSHRRGLLTRAQAKAEKMALLKMLDQWKLWEQIHADTVEMRLRLSSALTEVNKDGCELCKKGRTDL